MPRGGCQLAPSPPPVIAGPIFERAGDTEAVNEERNTFSRETPGLGGGSRDAHFAALIDRVPLSSPRTGERPLRAFACCNFCSAPTAVAERHPAVKVTQSPGY